MRVPQKVWDGARVVIGDSDDDNESQHRSEGAEREVLIMPKLDFGLPKKAKALVGKGEAFSPKSTTTLTRFFEDPLLLIYFGILISLWPSFYVNHYAHKQELRDNILIFSTL